MKKIALVTGGSKGIGEAISLLFGKNGYNVILTYNSNKELADKVVEEIKKMGVHAVATKLNLTEFSTLDTFVQNVKEILQKEFSTETFDCLINNAGIGKTVPFENVNVEMFDEFTNIHFKSVFFLCQKFVPFLNSGASIINISSGTTRFVNSGYSVYASLKGAIEIFSKYLAKELGPKNIRVNVVAPGPIGTDFNGGFVKNNENVNKYLSSLTPSGRVGKVNDVAPVVVFLCGQDAQWINGQRIEVSGGINL